MRFILCLLLMVSSKSFSGNWQAFIGDDSGRWVTQAYITPTMFDSKRGELGKELTLFYRQANSGSLRPCGPNATEVYAVFIVKNSSGGSEALQPFKMEAVCSNEVQGAVLSIDSMKNSEIWDRIFNSSKTDFSMEVAFADQQTPSCEATLWDSKFGRNYLHTFQSLR